MKGFIVIGLGIALAVPLTRLSTYVASKSEAANALAVQRDVVASAVDHIEFDFREIQMRLLAKAERLSNDPDATLLTTVSIDSVEPGGAFAASNAALRHRYDEESFANIELYDKDLVLQWWMGESTLPKPDKPAESELGHVLLEQDPYRTVLVVWMKVGQNGFVRTTRAIAQARSAFGRMRQGDLRTSWRDQIDVGLDLVFGDDLIPKPDPGRVVSVPLNSPDGRTLGTAFLTRPSTASIARQAARKYKDVEMFWWTVLICWLAAGAWMFVGKRTFPSHLPGARLVEAIASRVAILVAVRYGLVWLDVPRRWVDSGLLRDAFDPAHLASTVGGGIAASVGDLAITGVFAVTVSVAVLRLVVDVRYDGKVRSIVGATAAAFAIALSMSLVVIAHQYITSRSVLDSTLDFFAWTGLTPQPMVLIVFCSLLLNTIAVTVMITAMIIWYVKWIGPPDRLPERRQFLAIGLGMTTLVSVFVATDSGFGLHTSWVFAGYILLGLLLASRYLATEVRLVRLLRLRSLLLTILVAAMLLYPLVYAGMDRQRQVRLTDAAVEFADRGDRQVIEAATAVISRLRTAPELERVFATAGRDIGVDEQALLQIAGNYRFVDLVPGIQSAHVRFVRADGFSLGGFRENPNESIPLSPDPLNIPVQIPETDAIQIQTIEHPRTNEIVGYLAQARVDIGDQSGVGVILVDLDRRSIQTPFGSLFGYDDWRRSLSMAEFQDGLRVRSEGENFERLTLPAGIEDRLSLQPEFWQSEEVYGRAYLTYYRRFHAAESTDQMRQSVVAVRASAIIPYDHLYYLLRIALAGLWVGIPMFLLGLVIRWRLGLLPARRSQYGDRVLDAFLVVGTLAVAGMGLVGEQVITRENEGAIRSRLQRRLQRVEDALVRAAEPGEALYMVQQRMSIDSLASQLSLDLTVYHGPWLSDASTTALEARSLIGYRIPFEAYQDLFLDRFRQAFVESSGEYGDLFTVGYKALSDDHGRPRSVIAVLTFPEQARIREERARTTAYFFGALLLLLLVIMMTATTLARALTGPLKRLRDGLESVAEGRAQRPIPVETRDEVGQLVDTFNVMQGQLRESRRKLAQQERELAWREMARQVAHEIKNPLTPMKLSIQHLQRAYQQSTKAEQRSPSGDFGAAFERITNTIAEQIDTLAHIANEFSTFARMPKRHMEVIDVNQIIGEAVRLVQSEMDAGIRFVESTTPSFVSADREELRRVFINLLKNAAQSMDGRGTVVVTARQTTGLHENPDQQVVLFEVVDRGTGIAPEVQGKIFEPNFSTKTSGMGLGLAIAKKSVEDIRGEIGFSTSTSRGSTFWVKLPVVDS